MSELAAALKQRVLAEGCCLVGIAPAVTPPHYATYLEWLAQGMHGEMEYMSRSRALREHPERLLPGCRSVVMTATSYSPPMKPDEARRGRIAAYALGRDYHRVLRKKLHRVRRWLLDLEPDAQVRVCVDSTPLVERDYAWLAGIGWFGKNTCIINTYRGSYLLLGALLTTLELPPDEPAVGGCGTCRLCIDACPTGAIVEPGRLDARRCISYLTIEKRGEIEAELQPFMDNWVFGCDVCQEVCPFNQPRPDSPFRAAPNTDPEMHPRLDPHPRLEELVELSQEEFSSRFAGTAIMRAKHSGLVRNAKIALRNCRGD